MKIAIDIRNIGKGRTGDEVVFFELVKNLAQIDIDIDYRLLIDKRENDVIEKIKKQLGILNKNNFTIVQLGSGNKFVWNGWRVARYCMEEKIDIYHTQYIIPFFMPVHTKIVTHIHDVSFHVHKELISKKDAFFLNKLIPRALNKSDKIIAVSQFTKDEIIKYYNVAPEKISVVYNAVNIKKSGQDYDVIQKKYNLPEKYILALGTMQPRKNIPFLIEAFAQLVKDVDDVDLVLVGGQSHNFDSNIEQIIDKYSKLKEKIIFTGYVDEEDKFDIFAKAQVFAFPSLYEGFGVPILEAFETNTVVVASDIPSHREIGANGVLYFDVCNVDQCTRVLYDALVNDSIREGVLIVAQMQKEKFSWHTSAIKLQLVYKSL